MLNLFTEKGTKVLFTKESITRGTTYEQTRVEQLIAKGIITLDSPYVVKEISSGVKTLVDLHQIKNNLFNIILLDEYDGNKSTAVPKSMHTKVKKVDAHKLNEKFSPELLEKVWNYFDSNGEITTSKAMEILQVVPNMFQRNKTYFLDYLQVEAKKANKGIKKLHGKYVFIDITVKKVITEPDKSKKIIEVPADIKDAKDAKIAQLELDAVEKANLLNNSEIKVGNYKKRLDWRQEDVDKLSKQLEEVNKQLVDNDRTGHNIIKDLKGELEIANQTITSLDNLIQLNNGSQDLNNYDKFKAIADSVKDAYINSVDIEERKLIAAIIKSADVPIEFDWKF